MNEHHLTSDKGSVCPYCGTIRRLTAEQVFMIHNLEWCWCDCPKCDASFAMKAVVSVHFESWKRIMPKQELMNSWIRQFNEVVNGHPGFSFHYDLEETKPFRFVCVNFSESFSSFAEMIEYVRDEIEASSEYSDDSEEDCVEF